MKRRPLVFACFATEEDDEPMRVETGMGVLYDRRRKEVVLPIVEERADDLLAFLRTRIRDAHWERSPWDDDHPAPGPFSFPKES